MKRITYLLLSTLTIVVLLQGCNGCNNNKTTNKKVKVGYLNMVSSLTHFVAIEKGYYKEQNIEVEANVVQTSDLIAQELVTGHIDVGIELSLTPALKQLDKNPNTIKIFSTSNITPENGFDGIVVKNDSKIKEIKDLSNKRVGGFPGTTANVFLMTYFKQLYPNLPLPNYVPLTPNLHIQSLEANQIDALFAYEPVLTTGKVKNNFRQISASIYGSQFNPCPIGVGALNQHWYSQNTETAKSFLVAIDKAIDFINQNPNEAKAILAKATNLDSNIAKVMNTMPLSKSTEIDLVNLDKYLSLLKELQETTTLYKASEISIKQD